MVDIKIQKIIQILYMADVNATIYNEDGEILYTKNF